MVRITIPDERRELSEPEQIRAFLDRFGIWYERWDVADLDDDATDDEVLQAFGPQIERVKERGGFVTADIVQLTPATPDLDAICAKFDKEHTHSEDELRFTVKGNGVFHIHPDDGPVFAIHVAAGDLINVPRDTRHWFTLAHDRTIRCIRLFEDMSGWTPHYIEEGVHASYAPHGELDGGRP